MDNKLIPKKHEENYMIACQNCEGLFEDGANFCPHCGQKTNDDLTIGVLFYNTISNYFSFDARFLKSFLPLMIKPGYLVSKFIEGKRLMYLHPAQMYLFVSVIFFFIISFSTSEIVTKADEINKEVAQSEAIDNLSAEAKMAMDSISKYNNQINTKTHLSGTKFKVIDSLAKVKDPDAEEGLGNIEINDVTADEQKADALDDRTFNINLERGPIDSLINAGADDDIIYKTLGMSENAGFYERKLYQNVLKLYKGSGAGTMVQAFFDSIPVAMFFLLPIFAFIIKIFYFNKGRYVHHLVFSFYYFSFLFTVFAIMFSINRFLYDIPDWIDWLMALSTYIYFVMALKRIYRQGRFLTLLKGGIITFIFLLMVTPLTFAIVAGFSFIFS